MEKKSGKLTFEEIRDMAEGLWNSAAAINDERYKESIRSREALWIKLTAIQSAFEGALKSESEIIRNHMGKLTLQYSDILKEVEKNKLTHLVTDTPYEKVKAEIKTIKDSVDYTLFMGKILVVLALVLGCLQALMVYQFLILA